MLETLDLIGSFLVYGQTILMIPAIVRLYKDKKVAGMSIWTMAFYAFVSLFYVPIFFMSALWWTAIGVLILGIVESLWVVYAVYLTSVYNND